MLSAIETFVDALQENIGPSDVPQEIDLVLDVGMFGGAYMIGVVYYLYALEKKGLTKVIRISGASVGSIVAVLYLTGRFEQAISITHSVFVDELKRTQDLHRFRDMIEKEVPWELERLKTTELHISYRDASTRTLTTCCKFDKKEDLVEAIARSCHVPLMTANSVAEDDKYFDGICPKLFVDKLRPSLFVTPNSCGMFLSTFSLSREKNAAYRILFGIEDAHRFFSRAKDGKSKMCSYVEDWGVFDMISYRNREILAYVMYIILMVRGVLSRLIPDSVKTSFLATWGYDLCSRMCRDMVYLLMY